jgi:tetratricopeptide (TPR) repeat protein
LVCTWCGNRNVVKSRRNPLKITSKIAGEYVSFYAKKAKRNPRDTNALYAMGLLYLNLKNYDLARRSLRDAIDRSPLDAEVYYYYALALLAGESVGAMSAQEVERVEQYLGTALHMEVKCKYLVLLAVVREEYYGRNHLVCTGDTPKELFAQAADYTPDELDEIADHCILCSEEALYNIGLLTGNAAEKAKENNDEEEPDREGLTDEQIEAAFAMPAGRRRQYYDYAAEPLRPGYGFDLPDEQRLLRKGSYVELCLRRAWRLVLNAALAMGLLGACYAVGLGFSTTELSPATMTTGDYILLVVVVAPLLIWLLVTVNLINRLRESRRAANSHNRQIMGEYAEARELHLTRPTVLEMQLFILNYLSELVDRELARHGKSEKEMKGKILLTDEFVEYEGEGDNYFESAVEYTIALLEKDGVSVITSDWRVWRDEPEPSTISSIAYADIKEVTLADGSLSFGGITIDIPADPMFAYQSDDPDDGLAYSTTRTSDVRQFAVALRKLHTASKK